MNKRGIEPEDLILSNIFETPSYVIFVVSYGFPQDDNSNSYIGLHNRSTGATVITPAAMGIRDDLGGFMPFSPTDVTPSGTIVGVLTMEEIDDWMEQHPDAKLPDSLTDYKIENNPVLVLID